MSPRLFASRLFPSAGLSAIVVLSAIGCSARYVTPGGPADLAALGVTPEMRARQNANTEGTGIIAAFDREPLATFPANLAVVRVQGAGYRSYSTEGYGQGNYSVVSLRDLEAGDDSLDDHGKDPYQQLTDLPMIRGIAPLNRMVVGSNTQNDQTLRMAAAQVQADLLLIYTFDTAFHSQQQAAPLSFVTLGLSPTKNVRVTSTASAVLMDTRNGYIYGLVETTADGDQLASAWTSEAAIDQTRKRVERKAFDDLLGQFKLLWGDVIARHADNTATGG